MPKIALVCPNYHPRTCGVGDYSMRVGEELLRRGADVRVFTRPPAEAHPEAPALPVVAVAGKTPLGTARAIARAVCAWGADRALIQYTPHMFDAWRFGSPAAPLLAALLQQREVRTTVVAHELYLYWAVRPDLALGALGTRVQLAALLALVDDLIVTTESRLGEIRPLAKALRRRVRFAPVGPNALPVPPYPEPTRFRMGTFSTLAYGKRIDIVLAAFARVAREVPEADLILLGDIGDEEDPRFRRLARAVRQHPARDRIRLAGKLPLCEVAREVASLNAFLFALDNGASTRSGTLPLALGGGVPVVAWRGPETGSFFRSDDNVVFADALDGEAFAEAALRLRRDPELAARVSAGGRRLFEEELSWPAIVSRIIES